MPAIRRPGHFSFRRRAASQPASRVPPSTKIDAPRRPASQLSDQIRSEPATRAGSGVPAMRLAHTSGIPSASTRSAVSKRLRRLRCLLNWRRCSRLGVITQPPRPSSSDRPIVLTTWCSVTRSICIPISDTRSRTSIATSLCGGRRGLALVERGRGSACRG